MATPVLLQSLDTCSRAQVSQGHALRVELVMDCLYVLQTWCTGNGVINVLTAACEFFWLFV